VRKVIHGCFQRVLRLYNQGCNGMHDIDGVMVGAYGIGFCIGIW